MAVPLNAFSRLPVFIVAKGYTTMRQDPELSALCRTLRDEPVDDVTRMRLARRAMAAVRGAEVVRLTPLAASWRWAVPATAAAAIVAAFLLVGRPTPPSSVEIVSIQANGGVHLRWQDVGKGEYQVLRSTDPADFTRAERHRVRGTQFVDHSQSETHVVFYRVE
jgi:hypothetical protein